MQYICISIKNNNHQPFRSTVNRRNMTNKERYLGTIAGDNIHQTITNKAIFASHNCGRKDWVTSRRYVYPAD